MFVNMFIFCLQQVLNSNQIICIDCTFFFLNKKILAHLRPCCEKETRKGGGGQG